MPHVPNDERRRQIIAAAGVVISRDGFRRATTRRIADEAGAPLGSLHYTFRDKDELFTAVFQDLIDTAMRHIAEMVPRGCGLETGVRNIMLGYFDWVANYPPAGIALHEMLMWASRVPTARHLASSVYESHWTVYREALDQATDGRGDPDMLSDVAGFMFCALDGVLVQLLCVGDQATARRHLEQFIVQAIALAARGGFNDAEERARAGVPAGAHGRHPASTG